MDECKSLIGGVLWSANLFKKVRDSWRQGLTLVHFSAQLEPCLKQENTLYTLNTP